MTKGLRLLAISKEDTLTSEHIPSPLTDRAHILLANLHSLTQPLPSRCQRLLGLFLGLLRVDAAGRAGRESALHMDVRAWAQLRGAERNGRAHVQCYGLLAESMV